MRKLQKKWREFIEHRARDPNYTGENIRQVTHQIIKYRISY